MVRESGLELSEEKDIDGIGNNGSAQNSTSDSLENFVELDDLQELEGIGDLTGLGDVSDLGDLSDLQGIDMSDIEFPEGSSPDAGEEESLSGNLPGTEIPLDEATVPGTGTPEQGAVGIPGQEAEEPAENSGPAVQMMEPDGLPEGKIPGTDDETGIQDNGTPEIPDIDGDIGKMAEAPSDAESGGSGGTSAGIDDVDAGIDSMLDGLLESLDENGSLDTFGDGEAGGQNSGTPDTGDNGKPADSVTQAAGAGTEGTGGIPDSDAGLDDLLDSLSSASDLDMGQDDTRKLDDAVPAGTGSPGINDMADDASDLDIIDDLAALTGLGSLAGPGEETPQDDVAKKKKPGFFKRIFGNVVTDEIAEEERKAKKEEEEQALRKEVEAEQAKEEKEAKKAAAAEAKEAKKAEKEAKKAEKAEAKAAKKAEKEAKKQAEKEAEEQEIVGKLNKAGVTIVIIGAALILGSVILGTNIFGYNITKSGAGKYYKLQRYSDAYNEAMGSELKDKDPGLYEKIIAVMKVQQSLDAYSSYANMKYYPDALNALLCGLRKYDENIELARDLEIEDDFNVCKNRILSILKDEYGLSEKKAYAILELDTRKYTKRVVEIARKKI